MMWRVLVAMVVAMAAPALAEEVAAEEVAARPVISEIVAPGPVQPRSFTGTVEAEVTTNLAFLTLGRVASLGVAAGDVVKAGDVLATLDQVSLNEDLAAAEAALHGAQAQAEFAQQSLERVKALVARNVASQAQLESAETAVETSRAAVVAGEADLARAKDAAGYSQLTAPMDGVVTQTLVDPGTVVSVGTPVLTLAGLTGREAVVNVPAEFLSLLPANAVFEVTGRGSAPVRAGLNRVEPIANEGTRSRRLRLALQAAPPSYRLGSLIRARLAGTEASVMTLPKQAITGAIDQPRVWRVGEGRKVGLVPVNLGADLGERVVVTAGLMAGDEIVVRGVNSLSEGQVVGEGVQ